MTERTAIDVLVRRALNPDRALAESGERLEAEHACRVVHYLERYAAMNYPDHRPVGGADRSIDQ